MRASMGAPAWKRALIGLLTVALTMIGVAVVAVVSSAPASAAGPTAGAWPSSWNVYNFANGTPIKDANGDENHRRPDQWHAVHWDAVSRQLPDGAVRHRRHQRLLPGPRRG